MTETQDTTPPALTPGTPEYEAALMWLLELIAGARWPYSPGLTSYPSPEPQHQGLHAACLELERRGRVVRVHEEPGMVGWMPRQWADVATDGEVVSC